MVRNVVRQPSARMAMDGGVSSLLLMVDFRGGPVWHLMNYWIMGRRSLALNELLDYEEAQLGYFNFFWEAQLGYSNI